MILKKVAIPNAPEVKNPTYLVYNRFFETFEFGCWAYYNPDEPAEDFKFSKTLEIVPIEDDVEVFELCTKPFMI